MTAPAHVPIPLTWRSHVRAAFFGLMMVGFGIGAVIGADGWMLAIGLAVAAVGAYVTIDYVIAATRWEYRPGRLDVARLRSMSGGIDLDPRWSPSIDDVGRRDSMFIVESTAGRARVTPNVLVARSDVKQWLYLIEENRSAR